MARNLTASDRKSLIRLASTMPVGSPERKATLKGLSKTKTARRGQHDDLIREYVLKDADRDTLRLIEQAQMDLYGGPHSERGYPGFTAALREIARDLDFHDLWVDVNGGYVFDSEPEGYEDEYGDWVEPLWEDYIQYDARDVKRAVLGVELAKYV